MYLTWDLALYYLGNETRHLSLFPGHFSGTGAKDLLVIAGRSGLVAHFRLCFAMQISYSVATSKYWCVHDHIKVLKNAATRLDHNSPYD